MDENKQMEETAELNLIESEDEFDKKPKPKKSKKIWAVLIVLLIAIAGGAAYYFLNGSSSSETAYVSSVSSISSNTFISGVNNRFTGIVEPQNTKDISFDSSKTLGELYVKEGDTVKAGDKLFSYSVSDMSLELQQLNVDLEGILQSISEENSKINDLQNQKNAASSDQQLEYSTQIQLEQANLQELYLNQQKKQLEIDAKQKEIDSADVTSPIDGTIQVINDISGVSSYGDSSGAYIKIVADGNYLVKCTASEMNIGTLMAGDAVVIRSRIDETITWEGTISSVDTGSTASSSSNSGYSSDSSSENTASKYYFYVSPSSIENMMIGQHVTVEKDSSGSSTKTYKGILIPSYYIADLDSNPYIWKENNGKLKKQAVTIGEYNEETDEYEVTEGLSASDYIAYPDETLKEGMKAESFDTSTSESGDAS